MNYDQFFSAAVARLHDEDRYRVFQNIERIAGRFPQALWRHDGIAKEVTLWCSNDYLGMGQHPDVIAAAVDAVLDSITGALKQGDKVQISGFGTFEVRHRAARQGRNPQTGATIQIAASKAPAFKAGKALKDAVN